jgi:outer membrane biogenesis lipoprotein LolB
MALRHPSDTSRTWGMMLSLVIFLVIVTTFSNVSSAQDNQQNDFDGYMLQKQQQEAEHAAYQARLAAHEVSDGDLFSIRSESRVCSFFIAM